MKKLLAICIIMICAFTITAQTGNGVVAQINSPYAFTPTTVDSITTISLKITNTIGATNTISFSGLSAPFSVSTNSITIAANDSATINVSFNPYITGNFSDTYKAVSSCYYLGRAGIRYKNPATVKMPLIYSCQSVRAC